MLLNIITLKVDTNMVKTHHIGYCNLIKTKRDCLEDIRKKVFDIYIDEYKVFFCPSKMMGPLLRQKIQQ